MMNLRWRRSFTLSYTFTDGAVLFTDMTIHARLRHEGILD
jgi:hypothetical protein